MKNIFLKFNSLLYAPINTIGIDYCYRFLMNPSPSLTSNPLFSSIVTLYVLILLYLPHTFLKITLSPVLIATAILLLSLLRLGAAQKTAQTQTQTQTQTQINSDEPRQTQFAITQTHINSEDSKQTQLAVAKDESDSEPAFGPGLDGLDRDPNPSPTPNPTPNPLSSFVEWDVSAPLEVIYEAYEGEEEEEGNDDVFSAMEKACSAVSVTGTIERYPSLSRYYPETDTDSSSSDGEFPVIEGWDSPESICFQWEEDEDEDEEGRDDGLIEIALDGNMKLMEELDMQVEEDNLIEIDISPKITPVRFGNFSATM